MQGAAVSRSSRFFDLRKRIRLQLNLFRIPSSVFDVHQIVDNQSIHVIRARHYKSSVPEPYPYAKPFPTPPKQLVLFLAAAFFPSFA